MDEDSVDVESSSPPELLSMRLFFKVMYGFVNGQSGRVHINF